MAPGKQDEGGDEQRDVEREGELNAWGSAERATAEITPPVDQAGEHEEDAGNRNDPYLRRRQEGGERDDAEREPDKLLKGVLHDAAVNLEALTLGTQQGVVSAFGEAPVQNVQADRSVGKERNEQPAEGKHHALRGAGQARQRWSECVGGGDDREGSGDSEPDRAGHHAPARRHVSAERVRVLRVGAHGKRRVACMWGLTSALRRARLHARRLQRAVREHQRDSALTAPRRPALSAARVTSP